MDEGVVLRARVSFGEEPRKQTERLGRWEGKEKTEAKRTLTWWFAEKERLCDLSKKEERHKGKGASFAYASEAMISDLRS